MELTTLVVNYPCRQNYLEGQYDLGGHTDLSGYNDISDHTELVDHTDIGDHIDLSGQIDTGDFTDFGDYTDLGKHNDLGDHTDRGGHSNIGGYTDIARKMTSLNTNMKHYPKDTGNNRNNPRYLTNPILSCTVLASVPANDAGHEVMLLPYVHGELTSGQPGPPPTAAYSLQNTSISNIKKSELHV